MSTRRPIYLSTGGFLRLAWCRWKRPRGDNGNGKLNDPFPRVPHSQLPFARSQRRHSRLNFEGPILPHRLYLSEGSSTRFARPRSTLCLFRNQKLAGRHQFLHPVRLDRLRQTPGDRHGSRCPQRLGHVNMDYFNRDRPPRRQQRTVTRTLADGSPYSEACSRAPSPHAFRCRGLGRGRPG